MHKATVAPRDGLGGDGAPAERLRALTEQFARNRWGERAVRVGLAARGVVFLVLGYLVARVALGALGETSTSQPASVPGVPQALAAQPGGQVALAVLGVGLMLYALFSLLDTALHHNDESPAGKRWGDRALSAFGVVMYAGLSVYCFTVAFGGERKTSGQDAQQKTQLSATVLRWPAGWFWLGLFGVLLLVMAAFLVSRAYRRSFRSRFDRDRMSDRVWRAAVVLGTVGYLGRAALFAVVGCCILSAAVENDPKHGQGVNGSIRILAKSTPGPVLLWLLAASIVAYGLYMFVETRYRHV